MTGARGLPQRRILDTCFGDGAAFPGTDSSRRRTTVSAVVRRVS